MGVWTLFSTEYCNTKSTCILIDAWVQLTFTLLSICLLVVTAIAICIRPRILSSQRSWWCMCLRQNLSSRTAPLPLAFIARDATAAKITAHKNSIKEAGIFMKQTQRMKVVDQAKQHRISHELSPQTQTETQPPSPPDTRKSSWKFSQHSMVNLHLSAHSFTRDVANHQTEKEEKPQRPSLSQIFRKHSNPLPTRRQTDLNNTTNHSFRQRMATVFFSTPFLRRLTHDTTSHTFEAPTYRERQELVTLSTAHRDTKERRNSVLLRDKRRQSTGNDSLLQFEVHGGTQASVYEVKLTEIHLVKRLAFGPLSEVYAAIWRETKVGVKLLMPRDGVVDRLEDAVQNFRREIWVMSRLKHPNIVTLIGASLTPTCYVLVMEYMSNGSLYEYLRDEDNIFPHSMILTSALDIASGMNHLVTRQVLQRDLKSKNCLLSDNLVVKVADFGLARFKSADGNYTFVGTPFWAAPEVIRHEPYDEKADVYSFGIVLWELVERKDPYDGLNPFQVPLLVAQDGLRPHDYTRSAPLGLDHLMKQCWDSNPDQRPTFEEIEQTLDQWLKAEEDRMVLRETSIGEDGDQEGDLSRHIQRKFSVASEHELNRFAMSHSASSKVIPILLARGATTRDFPRQINEDIHSKKIDRSLTKKG